MPEHVPSQYYIDESGNTGDLSAVKIEAYFIEQRMDACQQPKANSEIDLRNTSEQWTSYLRKPSGGPQAMAINDPFPYDPNEAKF